MIGGLESHHRWSVDGGRAYGLLDDFSTDTIANYTFDAGSGTLAVSGGQLVPSTTAEKRLYHNRYRYTDAQVTLKVTAGSTVAAPDDDLVLARLDDSNFLFARHETATLMSIYKRDGGVYASLVSGATAALATATAYWLRFRKEGNVLTAEHWTAAPTPAGTPAATITHTLSGANATKFGSGIVGDVGLRLVPPDTGWRYDDFTVEPFVYPAESPQTGPPAGAILNDTSSGLWPVIVVDEIGGLHSLGDAEDQRDVATGKRGEVPRPSRRRGKTVTYNGRVKARTLPEMRQGISDLERVFDLIEGEGRMDVIAPSGLIPDRFFRARALKCDSTDVQATDHWERTFVAVLRLADPRVFNPLLLGPFSTGALGAAAGDVLPVTIPHTIPGGASSSCTVTVTNNGGCEADPLFTLYGPGRHPLVENVTLGLKLQLVDVDLATAPITIDFFNRRVLQAGTDQSGRVDPSISDWWDEDAPGLARGANVVRYSADGLASPGRAEVRFHEADPA